MRRREFIKSGSLFTLPLILNSCDWIVPDQEYRIQVDTDIDTGHILMESTKYQTGPVISTETLVVGGGISGLAAACALKHNDYIVCELSSTLGGSSSANSYNGLNFSQGAHYDLEYPASYGQEVLDFLESLEIVRYQPWKNSWSFIDEEHIILHRRKNRCYDYGKFRSDVLHDGPLKTRFLDLISEYDDQMPMPTRLIGKDHRHLNETNFFDFVSSKLDITSDFIAGLDYHMKDDYGAGSKEVSALAGIHYFKCRPYYREIVDLFSPPNGNNYFIEKMKAQLNQDSIYTQHLVSKIIRDGHMWAVDVVDVKNKRIKKIKSRNIIYAGHKHALKYIYPEEHKLFQHNSYAPWLVLNLITDNKLPVPGYWQNEMITEDSSFLGFVDSNTQHSDSNDFRVLTAYYCLPIDSRGQLKNVNANKEIIASTTIDHIQNYFGQKIKKHVKEVFIKVMGHAMPIPKPGYLFDDKNNFRANKSIAYAGVDNSRLPLLFEAIDSGLQAVKFLK